MLNAIALIILAGMMFIPIINLVVGVVAGCTLLGVPGGIAGAALAALITLVLQPWLGQTATSRW